MRAKKALWLFLLGSLLAGRVNAGNDALAQTSAVPLGERVANDLQVLLGTATAIVEAKRAGDLLSEPEIYRVGVTYDPNDRLIDLSVVGNRSDPKVAREKLEMTLKLVMGFNNRLQKNFGVSLGEKDVKMDYLDTKSGFVILKYRDGQYVESALPKATPTASSTSP